MFKEIVHALMAQTSRAARNRQAALGAMLLVATAACGQALANQDNPAQRECTAMVQEDFSALAEAPTVILEADVVPASDGMPEYCRLTGYTKPQIQFEMRLPTETWNGRYLQAGCGGFCGVVRAESCADAVARNFMAAAHNMGHVGGVASLPTWGSEPGLRRDFGTRSTHVIAVAAKAVAERYYGKRPHHSYLRGCSTGGREALGAAQFHPEDFDGLIAGDPAFPARQGGVANPWDTRQLITDDGTRILDDASLKILNDAVLAACDSIDGLVDGIIDDPRLCQFDPAALQCAGGASSGDQACLSARQVAVAKKLYDGPRDSEGRRLVPGYRVKGSELAWGDPGNIRLNFSKGYLAYLAFEENPPAGYDYRDFDFDRDMAKLEKMAALYDPVAPYESPNLDAFRERGGKLMLYHGWADPTVSPIGTLDYYAKVTDRDGGIEQVQSWFRLFMVPGMYHCRGGNAPNSFDMLDAIVAWVEDGEAPERIIASQIEDGEVIRTRPLFPYPAVARHTGNGDVNDAANWRPETPAEPGNDHIDWIWAPGRD